MLDDEVLKAIHCVTLECVTLCVCVCVGAKNRAGIQERKKGHWAWKTDYMLKVH